jgi:hypothetical protein
MFADEKLTIELIPDPFELYQIGYWQNKEQNSVNPGYRPGYPNREFIVEKYYDPSADIEFNVDKYDSTIKVDESLISIFETEDFEFYKPGKLN